ncbi:RHS repeat-associated core domain-containing protein [Aestuariibacter sp. AA17]|uniref:RHS repeat-associated core domain-containing protein n=1 Tax=Fluctibacter corallii TaxID=2984329 RepID=A0ABT3A9Y2_9ALTE|nr:RHS repeat-associated core domain-containing protein [Aestuariibacter sp. AA17]MCV2885498.1 RHS repeat-associated core domain-containing protein [Aestuariibacter sp. AA17]
MFYKNCLVKFGRSFGTLLNQAGSTDNDYLFTGEQYDSELDSYYLRARYYDQSVGRFTQMDEFEGVDTNPASLHKYFYGNGDPINNYDPSGYVTLQNIGISLRINSILVKSSTSAIGRSALTNALTGTGGRKAFGIVGNEIIGLAKFT